jgi:hypothetical protein
LLSEQEKLSPIPYQQGHGSPDQMHGHDYKDSAQDSRKSRGKPLWFRQKEQKYPEETSAVKVQNAVP